MYRVKSAVKELVDVEEAMQKVLPSVNNKPKQPHMSVKAWA